MSSESGLKAEFEEARAAAAEEAAQLRAESLRLADEDARHEAAGYGVGREAVRPRRRACAVEHASRRRRAAAAEARGCGAAPEVESMHGRVNDDPEDARASYGARRHMCRGFRS